MSEKSTTRQGLICAEILPLRVLLPSPPENNMTGARDPIGKPVNGQRSTLKNMQPR